MGQKLNKIFSETVNKIALSANDDKRIILDDGISTLAFGNKILPKSKRDGDFAWKRKMNK